MQPGFAAAGSGNTIIGRDYGNSRVPLTLVSERQCTKLSKNTSKFYIPRDMKKPIV